MLETFTRTHLTVGRVAGIPVGLNYSWFAVCAVVIWTLGEGYFTHVVPNTPELVVWGASVVGVDFSDEMLTLAASLHPTVTFGRADAAALPFADGCFDAVVAGFLMPHVSDLPAVCAELARVVRPGGRLALATWDPEPETFTRFLFESITESGATPPPSLPPGPPFFQYALTDEFTALLSGAGLADVSVFGIAFTHFIDDLDAFWADLVGGAVRASVLIRAQPLELQARIQRMYGERLERWRVDGGWDLACAVKVGAATRS